MYKYWFVSVRIPILTLKIIFSLMEATEATLILPGGLQQLILEADKVQIWRSNYNMPSYKSKYRFVSVRIPMEAAGGCQ